MMKVFEVRLFILIWKLEGLNFNSSLLIPSTRGEAIYIYLFIYAFLLEGLCMFGSSKTHCPKLGRELENMGSLIQPVVLSIDSLSHGPHFSRSD